MKAKLSKFQWSDLSDRVFERNANGVCHFRKGGRSSLEDLTYLSVGKLAEDLTEIEHHISGPTAQEPFHIEVRCFNAGGFIDYEILYVENIDPDKAADYALEAVIGFCTNAFRKKGGGLAGLGLYLMNKVRTSPNSELNLEDAQLRKLISVRMVEKVKEFNYGVMRRPKLSRPKKALTVA